MGILRDERWARRRLNDVRAALADSDRAIAKGDTGALIEALHRAAAGSRALLRAADDGDLAL